MTFSVPSFFASATRASMPPAPCAEVQVAAPLAALDEELLGAGGAQPAPSRTRPVVAAATAVIRLLTLLLILVVRIGVLPIRP